MNKSNSVVVDSVLLGEGVACREAAGVGKGSKGDIGVDGVVVLEVVVGIEGLGMEVVVEG